MLIQQLQARLTGFFDTAYANNGNKYVQRVILAAKALVLSRLDSIKTQMEGFFDEGKFDSAVDFLAAFVRGNVSIAIPWYARFFMGVSEGKLIDELAAWLKLNKGTFKDAIGALPPSEA